MPIQPTEPNADFKKMSRPDEWPIWPKLPLKRVVNGQLEMAVLLSIDLNNDFPMLFFEGATIFDAPLKTAEGKIVSSPEGLRELIKAGWVVD